MSSGLLSGNGSGVRGLFNEEHGKGTRKGGTIVEPFPYQTERREFGTGEIERWPAKPGQDQGDPKMQIVVTVQTDERLDDDDTGERRLYLKGRKTDLHDKVAAAVAATGADDFELGGTLWVTRTGKGQSKAPGGPKPWLYEVEYARPKPSSGLTGGGNTVLDRSAERQKAAKAVADDDSPPF
jgi:hypothetical protein